MCLNNGQLLPSKTRELLYFIFPLLHYVFFFFQFLCLYFVKYVRSLCQSCRPHLAVMDVAQGAPLGVGSTLHPNGFNVSCLFSCSIYSVAFNIFTFTGRIGE